MIRVYISMSMLIIMIIFIILQDAFRLIMI